ncbi:hypothetical protein FisN_1Hu064 [Fistulifera solaris]|uniref:Serine protease n=1 Tax=Fistulifera solaris TaxID=1519565 RepID=A0A1Z5JDT2_FISSO|nr:hypothetical protein FisN_1Hu064 [Fistulifera solaris]|eukprot:GAX12139.1 hypothetical protein FisN_1Hu064 [Fistulifera solaris]
MLAFCLLFFLCNLASAQVLEKIGDIFPIQFRSNGVSDIEEKDTPLGKLYIFTHPGATYIALHFAELDLLEGDSIEVTDANGGQAYTLTGKGKGRGAAFWSQHVKGDTIILNTLKMSHNFDKSSLFVVDEYAAGFESLSETICGTDNKENAACYQSSFPTEYNKSRAVARLLINGSNLCTGFLVSGSNHLLTNYHCIKTAADALNTDYEFMSEAPTCISSNSQLSHKGAMFDGAVLIKTSAELDYTLVQLSNGNPSSLYGFLELDEQLAPVGGQVYIPQHPGGKAKQLAIFSSHAADASDGFCHINNVGNTGCGGSFSTNLFYYCDTEGGSSGSPVISRLTNKVVGLHKCGGCTNGNHAASSHVLMKEFGSIIVSPPVPAPVITPAPVEAPNPVATPAPVAAPSPVATPIGSPTASAPVPTPTSPVATPTIATSAPVSAPSPIATPITAPTAFAPVETPTPPVVTPTAPIPAPVAAPSPIAKPVAKPVAKPTPAKPKCLVSGTRCSGPSKCCSGFCRANRKCR